jgi:hypothetical protein
VLETNSLMNDMSTLNAKDKLKTMSWTDSVFRGKRQTANVIYINVLLDKKTKYPTVSTLYS